MQTDTSSTTQTHQGYLKIIVVGDATVGKTSLVRRLTHNIFTEGYKATVGVDFGTTNIVWNGRDVVTVHLWDIAGQERFANLTRHYYVGATGAFIVMDITNPDRFFASKSGAGVGAGHAWKSDIESKVIMNDGKPIPILLVVNKCDMPSKDSRMEEEAMQKYARENGYAGCIFVSAKEGTRTQEAVVRIIKEIFERDPQAAERSIKRDEAIKLQKQIGKPASDDECAC